MSYAQHQTDARQLVARCGVVTLSDTRTPQTDTSGQAIRRSLEADGHTIAAQLLIPDEPVELQRVLEQMLSRDDVDAIVTNGGTGISRRDQTIGVVEEMLEQRLPGFGELFRMLSWEQIGSGAMLSRAVAGIARGKPIFAMPGSTKAVELAMSKLIVPELRHLLSQLRK
jgi:molybdenum cofactor biosynthesis protein B